MSPVVLIPPVLMADWLPIEETFSFSILQNLFDENVFDILHLLYLWRGRSADNKFDEYSCEKGQNSLFELVSMSMCDNNGVTLQKHQLVDRKIQKNLNICIN